MIAGGKRTSVEGSTETSLNRPKRARGERNHYYFHQGGRKTYLSSLAPRTSYSGILMDGSTTASSATARHLFILPNEILENILMFYCDSQTLARLWQAAAGSTTHSLRVWQQLEMVIRKRLLRASWGTRNTSSNWNDGDDVSPLLSVILSDTTTTSTGTTQIILQTQQLTTQLTVLEYCENQSNILWCGHMEFKDPMLPDWSAQHAHVILRADDGDESWSLSNLHGWCQAFPLTIKLVSQPYNFVPVRPRGRICGVSTEDRNTIQSIRRRLDVRDHVMTLRYRNDDGFILRIISPEQAQRRIRTLYRDADATNGLEVSPDGLICCWEYHPPEGEESSTPQDHLLSIARTVINHRRIHFNQL